MSGAKRKGSPRALLAEFLGTAGLVCAVVGSGIMAERLSGGNAALALLANTLATVFILYVLISSLQSVSGAHFNPVVTWLLGPAAGLTVRDRATFTVAQLLGALCGAVLANAMFDLAPLQWATKARGGTGQLISEVVATAGLVLVIARAPAERVAAAVATYIGAAYWFTASTSFSNPAVTFGRMFSDSFSGIAPASAGAFVLAQCLGGLLGLAAARVLDADHVRGT